MYEYAPNPIEWVDPFGLAGKAIWEKQGINFKTWFDKATISEISANKADVTSIKGLRYGGGKHEFFPVSLAEKAKSLGFTASELEKMAVPTSGITFTCVKDKFGNIIPDGKHHSSRASSYFHKWLMEDLKKANTKIEAKLIIARHHKNHMVLSKINHCSCSKECK